MISGLAMTSAHSMGIAEGGVFDENHNGNITKEEFLKTTAKSLVLSQ